MEFDIRNLSDDKAQLYFYSEIVSDELSAWSIDDQFPASVRDFLKDYKGKEIEIHVNSGGGSCFAGICIAEMIRQHEGKTVAFIDGLSASIATIISCACDEVHINPSSYWMMHNSWVMAQGNKNDLQETINLLDKMDNTIADAYMKHTKDGVTREQIVDMMEQETWLCGAEILDYFNFILEDEKQVAYAKFDTNNYKNVPQELLNQEEDDEEVCEECGKNPCECEEQQEDAQVEDKEQEIIDEVVEDDKEEEQQEEDKVCEECGKNPCECEEKAFIQAKKQIDFLNAQAFLKNYL